MSAPRTWPALRLDLPTPLTDADRDAFLVDIDDAGVIGLDEDAGGVSLYFHDAGARDRLARDLQPRWGQRGHVVTLDVPDEGWAARSQADLPAVRVDAIVVAPPWDLARVRQELASEEPAQRPTVIEIEPSTGFGTGHHQSTRLCLRALQAIDVRGLAVLDVGTGSGVLAIAAIRRGAACAVAIDPDPDAIDAAADSVARNGVGDGVTLRTVGLDAPDLAAAPLVFANLTGVLLRQTAPALQRLIAPSGRAILSGFTEDEARWVTEAFDACEVEQRLDEDGWVGLLIRRRD